MKEEKGMEASILKLPERTPTKHVDGTFRCIDASIPFSSFI
jgi:hypothetical protein